MRFCLMLSSMSACAAASAAITKRFVKNKIKTVFLEKIKATNFKNLTQHSRQQSFLFSTGNDVTTHQLFPIGSKSHKCVHFGSCLGRDFWTIRQILRKFTVLETDSRASFSLLQPIRHFCSLTPRMGLKWDYRRLRNALRKWLMLVFSETTNDNSFTRSSPQW